MIALTHILTNLTDKPVSIGLTTIEPGKSGSVSDKHFQRKLAYVSRMVKEGKLSFGSPVGSYVVGNADEGNKTPSSTQEPVTKENPLDTIESVLIKQPN